MEKQKNKLPSKVGYFSKIEEIIKEYMIYVWIDDNFSNGLQLLFFTNAMFCWIPSA